MCSFNFPSLKVWTIKEGVYLYSCPGKSRGIFRVEVMILFDKSDANVLAGVFVRDYGDTNYATLNVNIIFLNSSI